MTETATNNRGPGTHKAIIVLGALALLGASIFGLFHYRKVEAASSNTSPESAAISVAVAPVTTGRSSSYLTALGTVTAQNTVSVRTRVDGQVMEVFYREGELVRKGSRLAQIDPRPFQIALEQGQGQLARDEAQLQQAQIDLARYEPLAQKKAIPLQQLDQQRALVKQFEGVVKIDQSQIANAQLNLTYCRVEAPIDGRVGLRLVDSGNLVRAADANSALLVITQVDPITVVFNLAEDHLPELQRRLRAHRTIAVEAWDRANRQKLATGSVLSTDNLIDPASGTIKVRAVFKNIDGKLFPNQFVNARLVMSTKDDAILVNSEAVQRNGERAFVYVVGDDSKAQKQPISVASSDGTTATVLDGLHAGQLVVTQGLDRLQDGLPVRVVAQPKLATTTEGQ